MAQMDLTAGAAPVHEATADTVVYRHSLTTRLTHWIGALALLVLVMSGLQIFNAAPYLDASGKSDPARRVLQIGAVMDAAGNPVGAVQLFGVQFATGHLLGYTDDGQGGLAPRAFPGWLTLPGFQDLASGRRWHLFFGWVFFAVGVVYFVGGLVRKDLGLLVLRPSDLPKLWPMQLY
jgi:thiosulfate reductase cytochrome b subunit